MLAKLYSNDETFYQLAQGFSLQRASNEVFTKHWAVYRRLNEDFSQSLKDQTLDLIGVPFCFWIYQKEQRIGGIVLLPNNIGDFFLIPPYDDAATALQQVIPLLRYWSDPNKDIQAQGITSRYVEIFQLFGFRLLESRRWMIRPTASLTTQWPAQFEQQPLQPVDAERIAGLLYESFAGGVGLHGHKDVHAHLRSVRGFFETYVAGSTAGQASIKIVDKEVQRLAGVCLVTIHKDLPCIQFVAVAPYYQGQRLGTNMLFRAISTVKSEYDWLKLAVTIGNPAEVLYNRLGFCRGGTVHSLLIPTAKRRT